MSRIVNLYEVSHVDNEWAGSFLALHEDGTLSRVQTGFNDKGECVRVVALPVVTE